MQHDGPIQLSAFNGTVQVGRITGLDEYIDLGEFFHHARQDVRQHARQRRGAGTQAQFAGDGIVIGKAAQVGHVTQQVAATLQDARAFLGDADCTPHARNQRRANLSLQRTDLLRHCRRGDVEQAGRGGHRTTVNDSHEGLEELGVHAVS